jgi:hypothetical protein
MNDVDLLQRQRASRTVLGVHLACVAVLAMFLGSRISTRVGEAALAAVAAAAIAQTTVATRWLELPDAEHEGPVRTMRRCGTAIVSVCWLFEFGFLAAVGNYALTGSLNRAAAAFFGLTIVIFAAVTPIAAITTAVTRLRFRRIDPFG